MMPTKAELDDALFHICMTEKTYRWAYMRLLSYPDIQIQHKNILTKGLQSIDRVEEALKRWHKKAQQQEFSSALRSP